MLIPNICHLDFASIVSGILWWLSGKEFASSAGAAEGTGLILGREDPLEEGMATHSSILA